MRDGSADVVVVGGGIAGLVAARELSKANLNVTLVEASARLGGKVASHQINGVMLDAGAESFATRDGIVASLLTELGLYDDIVAPNPGGAWIQPRSGAAKRIPKTSILGIPAVPLARDVIHVIGFAGALRAQLDSFLPGFVGTRERYLGPFVKRRMGRAVAERLVAPIASGVHSRHPDLLELDAVAPGLRRATKLQDSLGRAVLMLKNSAPAGSAVAGLTGGMHRIVDALAADLRAGGVQIRMNCTIVNQDSTGVTTSSGKRISAKRVVLATALTPHSLSTAADSRIVLATLLVEASALDSAPRGTGLLVAPGSDIEAKALTHASAKWAWLANELGESIHVLRLSYNSERLAGRDLAGLAELARMDAEALLGCAIPAKSVRGFARQDWSLPPERTVPARATTQVGEAISGTGLAAVIAHARRTASDLVSDLTETPFRREDDGQHDH